MVNKIKVLFVTHHWKENSHHSNFGGYERLVEFMPKNKVEATVITWGSKNKIEYKKEIKIITLKIPNFAKGLFKRVILSKYASKISSNFDIIHALYDDVSPFNSKCPIVLTVHTIKELDDRSIWLKIKSRYTIKQLKEADKVIILSRNMMPYLKKYISTKKIAIIPHGVDRLHFNKKNPLIKHKFKHLKKRFDKILLTIGAYGTDYDPILKLSKDFPNFLFVIIGRKKEKKSNILNLNKINEKDLLEWYNISNALFRPLKFASANNSILEALSFEKPIITNIKLSKEYDMSNFVIYKNYQDLKIKVSKLKKNPPNKVDNLDWKNISNDLLLLYKEVIQSWKKGK